MADFLIPDNVSLLIDRNGCAVLLNGATGRWHALNTTGTEILMALHSGQTINEVIIAFTANHPAIPVAQVAMDVDKIVSALLEHGLLVVGAPRLRLPAAIDMAISTIPDHIRVRDHLAVATALPVALLLLSLPFRFAVGTVRLVKKHWTATPANKDEVLAVIGACHAAARYYPGRFACLQVSLTCVLALALRRRAAGWVFGASTDPLSFHSWVEIDGEPIVHPLDEPVTSCYEAVFRV